MLFVAVLRSFLAIDKDLAFVLELSLEMIEISSLFLDDDHCSARNASAFLSDVVYKFDLLFHAYHLYLVIIIICSAMKVNRFFQGKIKAEWEETLCSVNQLFN